MILTFSDHINILLIVTSCVVLICLKLLLSNIKEDISASITVSCLWNFWFLILKEWSPSSHSKHHKKKLNQQLEMSPSGIAANVLDSGKTNDNSQQQVPTCVLLKSVSATFCWKELGLMTQRKQQPWISNNSKFIVVGFRLIHKLWIIHCL